MVGTMTHLSEERIDAAMDGAELAPNELEHLRACETCLAQVARLRTLREQLAALPRTIEPHVDGWPRVRETVRVRRARRRTVMGAASLALAAAVLFAIVRVVPTQDQSATQMPPVAAELAELREVVPAVVVDAMAANLTIYDTALHELEAHAATDVENADVRQRIDDLRRKRAALLRLASNS